MLTIRLQRIGKKNKVQYHLVVTESTKAASKAPFEVLALYNPHTKAVVKREEGRIEYWLSQRLPLSASAHNLLVKQGIVKEAKVKSFTPKKKDSKKK